MIFGEALLHYALFNMCSNDNSATALVPYNLKSLTDPSCSAAAAAYMSLNPNLTQAALEHYRLQLYNYATYADRFRYSHPALASHFALATSPYGPPGHPQSTGHHEASAFAAALSPYSKFDPRIYRIQEEPKPQHSYIGLIGMAILSAPDKKLVLSDIYQYILDNYAYFRTRGPGWRNSIRHNLSLNDCFIKAGRSANGKGHYWAIHPANIEDFKKGDFRRRKAQRRVRKHMGLAVPEDDDSTSPPPPPPSTSPIAVSAEVINNSAPNNNNNKKHSWEENVEKPDSTTSAMVIHSPVTPATAYLTISRRRQFDVESLLAPDNPLDKGRHQTKLCNDSDSQSLRVHLNSSKKVALQNHSFHESDSDGLTGAKREAGGSNRPGEDGQQRETCATATSQESTMVAPPATVTTDSKCNPVAMVSLISNHKKLTSEMMSEDDNNALQPGDKCVLMKDWDEEDELDGEEDDGVDSFSSDDAPSVASSFHSQGGTRRRSAELDLDANDGSVSVKSFSNTDIRKLESASASIPQPSTPRTCTSAAAAQNSCGTCIGLSGTGRPILCSSALSSPSSPSNNSNISNKNNNNNNNIAFSNNWNKACGGGGGHSNHARPLMVNSCIPLSYSIGAAAAAANNVVGHLSAETVSGMPSLGSSYVQIPISSPSSSSSPLSSVMTSSSVDAIAINVCERRQLFDRDQLRRLSMSTI